MGILPVHSQGSTEGSWSLLVYSTGRYRCSFCCHKPTPSQDRKVKQIGSLFIESVDVLKFIFGRLLLARRAHFFGPYLENLAPVVSKWRHGFVQKRDSDWGVRRHIMMFFHKPESCGTVQSKEKRNGEYKPCLNDIRENNEIVFY